MINAEGEYQAAEKLSQAAQVLTTTPILRCNCGSSRRWGGGVGAEHHHVFPGAHRSRDAVPGDPPGRVRFAEGLEVISKPV